LIEVETLIEVVLCNSPHNFPTGKRPEAAERRQLSRCGPFVSSNTESHKKQRRLHIYNCSAKRFLFCCILFYTRKR